MIHPSLRLLLGSAALIASTLIASAARAADACPLELIGTGIVVAVLDGRSFLLDDGREVRLAGLHVPLLARAGDKDDSAAAPPRRRWNHCSPARR